MGGTSIGNCSKCGCDIDYDPLQGGKQFCTECTICPECGEERPDDTRVKEDMKCSYCAY